MKMGNHVPVIVIAILISSVICATTPSSTETPATTATTSTNGDAPSACAGGVGQFGKQYTIVSTRHYTALVWVRSRDDRYAVTCNPSCSPIAGYSASLNDTHTTLTISSLTQGDVGLPQCSISSDGDSDSLEPGTQLTLTVNITDYYCSLDAGFDLTTGDVTDSLMKSHNVSDISDLSVIKTFSVDVRKLGDVTLNFVCDRTWNVTCNGVQELFKTPPQCTIHGDTNTNALVPATKLTLTVDINNYYCPGETGFNLTTGHVTEELMASHKVSDISDLSVNKTFSVDVRKLGDVTLNFVCDRTWNVTCNGVQELFKTPPQCTIHGDTNTNALVPATKLTLTVDINNYYCPGETGFNLTTGHVTEELMASHKVSDISDLSVNKTFSVDVRRLGDVTLNFVCDRTWNVTCNGVQELFKTPPQCTIHGNTNTNALVPSTKLTLTVDINNYYCPGETGFNLTTGHVTEELMASHKVSDISDLSVNKTFSVDVQRLGDVTLNFVCDRTWSVTCNGVQELFKTPPQCTIHGDTNTNALVPGTKLTLTVDINNYYCPGETGFNLTTGHVTEELMASHKVSDISDLSVNKTFSVDVRRLGDVTLNFVCDRTWSVTCNGVQELFKTVSSTQELITSTAFPSTTPSTTPSTSPSTTPSTTASTSPSTTASTSPSTTPSTSLSTTPSTTASTSPSTTPEITTIAGSSTRSGSLAATAGPSGATSPTATDSMDGSSSAVTQETWPTTVTATTPVSLNTSVIAIVVPVIVLLIGIIIIIIVCCRRKYQAYRLSKPQNGRYSQTS